MRIEGVKTPSSPFFEFVQENRSRICSERPELAATDVIKALGVEWKELSSEIKDKYSAQHFRVKEAYIAKKKSLVEQQKQDSMLSGMAENNLNISQDAETNPEMLEALQMNNDSTLQNSNFGLDTASQLINQLHEPISAQQMLDINGVGNSLQF